MRLAEYIYNCMSLCIWVPMFPNQQLYQKTLYYQQEYCTISKYWSYLWSLMLILFLSLTLPGLDRHLLAHREGDAPPRVKEITEGQTTAEQPDDLNTPLATGENTALTFRVFHVLPLILYIVFDIVLCHYLLLYICIVLIFLLSSYIAFVTKLYHCVLYNLLCAT